jgi:hypothetical protein
MSVEANSKPLFNFSTWPTEVIATRYEELTNNIATCAHGEDRARAIRMEANQAGFELIYRQEQLAPAALALVLEAQLFTDCQPVTV